MVDYITSLVSHEQSMHQCKVETCLQKLSVMQATKHIIMLSILQRSAMKLFSIGRAIIQMEWMHATVIFQLTLSFIVVMTELDMIMKSS